MLLMVSYSSVLTLIDLLRTVNYSEPEEIPEHVKRGRRYADVQDYDIRSCSERVKKDVGKIDILVHAVANAPEVQKPLIDTSREGKGPSQLE